MKTIQAILLLVSSSLSLNGWADAFDAVIDLPPRYDLSLPVSGIVNKVAVTIGQQVTKGELLLAFDDAPFRTERDFMQARVDFYQAKFDEAKRDLDHQQELYDRTVLSTVDLENAQLRVRRDKAMLQSARSKLARANYAFSHSRLIAPFDALVVDVQVNEGQVVNNVIQSKTLVSLVKKGYYTAGFTVTAQQLGGLALDAPVNVVIGDKQYTARISAIDYQPGASADDREKRFRAEAVFAADQELLPAGIKASVLTD